MRNLLLGTLVVTLALSAVRADEQAEAKAIVDQAVKAIGGADKAAKLDTVFLKGKGTSSEGGMTAEISFDISLQGIDRVRLEFTIALNGQSKKATLVLNDDKAWSHDSDRNKTEEIPKESIALFRQFLLSLRLAGYPAILNGQKQLTLAPGGLGKVDDVEASILRVTRNQHDEITLYYDRKSGFPLKSESRIKESDGQEKNYEFHFSDFKDVGAVKHFSRVKLGRDGKVALEFELSDFKVGEKFEANAFEKP